MVDKQIGEMYELLGNHIILRAAQDLLYARQNEYLIKRQISKLEKQLVNKPGQDKVIYIDALESDRKITNKIKKLNDELLKMQDIIKQTKKFLNSPEIDILSTIDRKTLIRQIDDSFIEWKKESKKNTNAWRGFDRVGKKSISDSNRPFN